MPGMNTVGTNTADKNQRDGHHRPGDLLHRFERRVLGREALLDVAFDGLDDDDGVIDHQSNGQHQAEEREGVDGKPKDREERKGSDQRNRHGQQRDERRPPALQENIYDDHHQQQGLPQRRQDFHDAPADRQRRVQRDGVIEVLRELLLELLHQILHALGGVQRVGAGQLVNGHDRRRVGR